MVRESLNESVVLYRPALAQNATAKRTFKSAVVHKVKFNQPARATYTDTTGAYVQSSAVLFFNIGRSYFSANDLGSVFKAGDLVVLGEKVEKTPPEERFVVKSVTLHRFKGVPHHYEVTCV